MKKIHQKNGFEYGCERYLTDVTWYFRPIGFKAFLQYCTHENGLRRTLKADMEALLNTPESAKKYYDEKLLRDSNVEEAAEEFERAKSAYEVTQAPGWEDNFRGNNPGKIGRREADLRSAMEGAKARLDHAKKLRALIDG